ncbi:MAG: hypothetical protein ACRENI_00935 [Gemmatimonadaceae bacterium]
MHRTLDRKALERVLARAAELQAGTPDSRDDLTEEQFIELGREVGLAPHNLRQALAEERTRVAVRQESGSIAAMFGPAAVSASRTLSGTPDSLLAALDRWMQKEECLQIRRRFADRLTWEARRDLIGNIKRGFNLGGRGYALARAVEVGATAVRVDEGRVLVRLDADISGVRRTHVRWGTASLAGGLVAGGGVIAFVAALPLGSLAGAAVIAGACAAAGAAGTAGAAHTQRKLAARAQLALEQVLDRLEHGGGPSPSVLAMLSAATRMGP